MPRLVDKSFPPAFAELRDSLLETVRSHASAVADELRTAGKRLDREYSDAGVRERLRHKAETLGRRAGRSGASSTPIPLAVNHRRAERIAWAIAESRGVATGDGDPENPMGRHLQRGEREGNALYFIVIAGLVLDPDVADWLDGATALARCPWVQSASKRTTPKRKHRPLPPHLRGFQDRREVMGDWGHDALRLLQRACEVRNWCEAKPLWASRVHRPATRPSSLPMSVIADDRPDPGSPLPLPEQIQVLQRAFTRFYEILDATTVPVEGGRRVDGVAHAVALSEATSALHSELRSTTTAVIRDHGVTGNELPPGVRFLGADSPDGPWIEIPVGKVSSVAIGGGGADALLLAALNSATRVAAYPADRWNAKQAARPGGPHQRWHAGDLVSSYEIHVLESAAKLLRIAPGGPSGDAEAPSSHSDGHTNRSALTQAPTPQGRQLTSAQRRAGESFEWVSSERPDLAPPADASRPYCFAQWQYIKEHGCPAYPEDEAGNPQVPRHATWERYVREHLRVRGGPQRSPRAARPTGRSIIRAIDIGPEHRGTGGGADS